MPKIAYVKKNFRAATLGLIEQANEIIAEYQAAGFSLTLRQLYYQMVARAIIPNRQQEYKRLGQIINNARLAGLIDWLAIEDRTRHVRRNPHWAAPVEIMRTATEQYQMDKWRDQDYRVEVWIEKDALVGVIAGTCSKSDVAYFSCRGYTSASAVWQAARRFRLYAQSGQEIVVLHLADHDPSGIDMTRDISERLKLLAGYAGPKIETRRIALTMDQIEEHNPPPNPAKITDSRFNGYVAEYGMESWELDALEPQALAGLIEEHILGLRDDDDWKEKVAIENAHRVTLQVATYWTPDEEGAGAMNFADTFEELVQAAIVEETAYATFSSPTTGVFWQQGDDATLVATAAFLRIPEKETWIMTDWVSNVSGPETPNLAEGFIPIEQAVDHYHSQEPEP